MNNRRRFFKNVGTMSVSLATGMALTSISNGNRESKTLNPSVARSLSQDQWNAKIKSDREIALRILKPTKKELERGMALHEESVVFDTYGFMPRAALDGDVIAAAIEDRASELELKDMKEDQSMTRYLTNKEERDEFIMAWKAAGVTCVFQNAGEESNTIKVLLKRLARFIYVSDQIPEIVGKAIHPHQVEKAKAENRHMLYLSGNGVPMPLDMTSLEEELRYIRVFYELGIRMMHLTYNRRNLIGDGVGESTDAGLSDFGREVVKEMNRVGVLVDIAHSGWQTSLEAAQISEKPIVASHTTVAGIHKHIRSKPDKVIKAIADKEGYIGICCIPRFLGGNGNIKDMMGHVDYVAKKYGPDYVGIGTDVAYTSIHSSTENQKIPSYRRSRTRWEALWPEDPFRETEDMRRSMAWTNWPMFTVGMVQMGYSDDDIRKIIGGNALRVLRANKT